MKTLFTMSMTGKRGDTVKDRELHRRILRSLWVHGEMMESEFFPLVGSHSRVRPILDDMCEHGILKIRIKEEGRRVPIYSYTGKGELYCLLNMFTDDIFESGSELDMESGEISDIYDNLRRRYDVRYGEETSPIEK